MAHETAPTPDSPILEDHPVGAARWVLGTLGVLVGAYGAWLWLSRQDFEQHKSAVLWLVSGVILHDFVLAPIVLGLVVLGSRVVPVVARVPVVVGLVVLATVTILAIPVLGGFGERPDNPSLLNRNYPVGWLVLTGLVVLAVLVTSLVQRARQRRGVSLSRSNNCSG